MILLPSFLCSARDRERVIKGQNDKILIGIFDICFWVIITETETETIYTRHLLPLPLLKNLASHINDEDCCK